MKTNLKTRSTVILLFFVGFTNSIVYTQLIALPIYQDLQKNLKRDLVECWLFDEVSGPSIGSFNNLPLTKTGNVGSVNGIEDGQNTRPKAAFINNGKLSGNVPIDYTKSFTVSGWFGLFRSESYNEPFDQALIGKWDVASNKREWLIWFKMGSEIVETTLNDNKIQSGKICFRISLDGSSDAAKTVEVCSDFLVYSDAPFFVTATVDRENRQIKLSVGSKDDNLKHKIISFNQTISQQNAALTVGKISSSDLFPLIGTADNICIWNRSITNDELNFLANGSNPKFQLTKKKKTIAFLGDSNTYGFSARRAIFNIIDDKHEFPYPRRTSTLLTGDYLIANYGSRGTSIQSANRFFFGNRSLQNGVVHMNYDWICIAYGINDLRNCKTVNEATGALKKIYDTILSLNPNVKLIKLTIPPFFKDNVRGVVCPSDEDFRRIIDGVNSFIIRYRLSDRRVFLIDDFQFLRDQSPNDYDFKSEFNDGDFIHYSQEAHDLIAERLSEKIIERDCQSPIKLNVEQIQKVNVSLSETGEIKLIDPGYRPAIQGVRFNGVLLPLELKNHQFLSCDVGSDLSVQIGLGPKTTLFDATNFKFSIHVDALNIKIFEGQIEKYTMRKTGSKSIKMVLKNKKIQYFVNGVLVSESSLLTDDANLFPQLNFISGLRSITKFGVFNPCGQ